MSIDMSRSGWDNPEGFQPRERDQAPPPVEACEAAGPDGWVCDLKPGHGGNTHAADGGPAWPMEGKQRPEPAPLSERWAVMPPSEADRTVLAKVRETARAALEHDRAGWAIALGQIVEMTRGY